MNSSIRLLCTNIGRGHPFYLDGLRQELARQPKAGGRIESHLVTEVAGPTGVWAWRAIRFLYERGSQPGLWAPLYASLRSRRHYNRDHLALRLLQRSWHPAFARRNEPLVVAHPLLVAALRPHPYIHYQHGEVVTPTEALVKGAYRVFVPTPEAASAFLRSGYDPSQVITTGLCIEPGLVDEAEVHYRRRLDRLAGADSLTGAFFSSGAEPSLHVRQIAQAASSVARAGGVALVFASRGGRLERAIEKTAGSPGTLSIITFESRSKLEAQTVAAFSRFDYFVSPAHERTHWALGLGLPMFLVGPDIGPFAPLNRELARRHEVAYSITGSGDDFASNLEQLRSQGALEHSARRGWGRYGISGFRTAAEVLCSERAPTAPAG